MYSARPRWLPNLRSPMLAWWLLCLAYLASLGAAPLFDVDEGAFAEASREMLANHDWGHTTLNGADRFDKPILVYWLQAASMAVFGINEWAVRLPSALCALSTAWVVGLYGARAWGPQARWPAPMLTLPGGPAQFGFDHGALGATPGRFTFVISDAADWIEAGLPVTEAAVLAQARDQFPVQTWPQPPRAVATLAERRATFRCTPGLQRPAASVAPGLTVAGDFVAGPYPATLEGAVRAGEAACAQVLN